MGWLPSSPMSPRHGRAASDDISLDNEDPFEDDTPPRRTTPLPKMQVFILCAMRLAEPVCFWCLFPLLPDLVKHFGVANTKEQVGYSALLSALLWCQLDSVRTDVGMVESAFAATQFATVLQWGRLSDRIGRRPVLIIGLLGVAASMLLFGLARSFIAVVIARCLSGALSGNVGAVKAAMGELSDETNQARAYSFLPLVIGIGGTIGAFRTMR